MTVHPQQDTRTAVAAAGAGRHVLVVSFLLPQEGTGTGIVLLRHLRRLAEEGWRVTLCGPQHACRGRDDLPQDWRVIPLPLREWWWPPVRQNLGASVALRARLWAAHVGRQLDEDRPDAILTVLWDDYPLLARELGRRWGMGYTVLLHDQQEFWAPDEDDARRIADRNSTITRDAAKFLR